MANTDKVTIAALTSPPIWNPNAAANWCLLFTPAFGAYLHALNWRALDEPEKAAASLRWFYAGIGLLVFYVAAAVVFNDKLSDVLTRLVGFVFLLTWYFTSARTQAKYVKQKFGSEYNRRPWGKALGLAVASLLAYFAFAIVVGVAAALVA